MAMICFPTAGVLLSFRSACPLGLLARAVPVVLATLEDPMGLSVPMALVLPLAPLGLVVQGCLRPRLWLLALPADPRDPLGHGWTVPALLRVLGLPVALVLLVRR